MYYALFKRYRLLELLPDSRGARSVQPVPLKRVLFWSFYVLGTLLLGFGILLSLVPGRIRDFKDFLFYFIVWASPASLLLICYWLHKTIMDKRNCENEGTPSDRYRVFGFLTWLELAFCLIRMAAILFYFLLKRR